MSFIASGERRIAVDWDGTCVESRWPETGPWLPGAREGLHALLDAGLDVVIYTTRIAPMELDEQTPRADYAVADEITAIREMLDSAHLFAVQIWQQPWKPGAVAYVDDRAIEFEFASDWPQIVGRILTRVNGEGASAGCAVEHPLTGGAAGDLIPPADRAAAPPARHPGSQRFHEILAELGILHDRKQSDYGRDNDPFANVRGAAEWGVPAWVGALIRATDKVRRLQTQAQRGSLSNESALDAFDDLAVYAVIGRVLFEEDMS